MAFHTVNAEEVCLWSVHINELLASDQDLARVLPINPSSQDLFSAVSNGVLLCKLINKIKPNTIPKIEKGTTRFHWATNIGYAIAGARALGCKIINIGPTDVIEGNKYLILGLIWQLIRAYLLSRVSVEKCPAIVTLMRPGETPQQFLSLPPEENLLRWVNWHLGNSKCPVRIANFGHDIADSQAYLYLLNQLEPSRCSLAPLQEPNPVNRAHYMLQNASALLPANLLPSPEAVANAEEKINLAFVASLFYAHPGLPNDNAQQDRIRSAVNQQLQQEEQAFRGRLAAEEEVLRGQWVIEEAQKRKLMQEEETAHKTKLDEQERLMRAEWERRVQHGEEVDNWRASEEARLRQMQFAQEEKARQQAAELQAAEQLRQHWESQHAQLNQQRAELDQLEHQKKQRWEQEEEERRRRWQQEEEERRRRWGEEDRRRQQEFNSQQQFNSQQYNVNQTNVNQYGSQLPGQPNPNQNQNQNHNQYNSIPNQQRQEYNYQQFNYQMYNINQQQQQQQQQQQLLPQPQPGGGFPSYPPGGYPPPPSSYESQHYTSVTVDHRQDPMYPPPPPMMYPYGYGYPPPNAPVDPWAMRQGPPPLQQQQQPPPPFGAPHLEMGFGPTAPAPVAPVHVPGQLRFFEHVRSRLRRDYTLVVDKSGSMAGGLWREAGKAVAYLAPNVCKADPDGVDIWFFSNPMAKHPHYENIRTPEQVNALFSEQNTGGTTDLTGVLQQVFTNHFARSRPETVLVITDGEPNNRATVKNVIRDAANKLAKDEDLSDLDDNIEGARFDIVDTVAAEQLHGMSFSEFIMKSIHD